MELTLRLSEMADAVHLKQLWIQVFGDTPDYVDEFFRYFFYPGSAALMEVDGQIVSSIHTIPMAGLHLSSGRVESAAITYALATDPAYRNLGFGQAVMQHAIQNCFYHGYNYNALWPAKESLFKHYTSHNGYYTFFHVQESLVDTAALPAAHGSVVRASPETYNSFRNNALKDCTYLMLSDDLLAFVKWNNQSSGGDLVLLEGNRFYACAGCEYLQDGTLTVQELLCPEIHALEAVALLKQLFPTNKMLVRTPSGWGNQLGGIIRRCGQLQHCTGSTGFLDLKDGYYGFAMD